MKKHASRWRILLGLASSALVLAACGGGGGGGGGGDGGVVGPTVPASYTGLTSQAVLNNTTAPVLVSGAWEGGVATDGATGVVPLASQANAQPPGALLGFSSRLKELVLQHRPVDRAVAQPVDIPLVGTCAVGGSANITMDLNETSGAFTGQINFDNYCTLGTPDNVIAGVLSFSGQSNPAANGFVSLLQLQFNSLTLSDAVASPTFSRTITEGTATFTFAADGLSEVDTLNYVLRDNDNLQPKTYWVNNYVLPITYGLVSGIDEVGLSGRYYDSALGYVDISTSPSSPLLMSLDPLPNGGVLLFSGLASQARLSFDVGQTSLLEVDASNSGQFVTIPSPL